MNNHQELDHRIEDCIDVMKKDKPAGAYETCRQLTQHFRELIVHRDQDRFRKYLASVTGLYDRVTCNSIRLAIDNILIYRIGDVIMLQPDRKAWVDMLPAAFRKKMCQQIFASGI